MTTPAAVPEYRLIDLDLIVPTPENRRHIDKKDPDFIELVDSVKAKGVRIPGIGRDHPVQVGKIDLRCGARRYAASRAAGLTHMPVILRPMTDREAIELTAIENMHRADLTPLEEARTIRDLVEAGNTLPEVADQLGKDVQWVARRLKLCDLHMDWVKAYEDPNGDFHLWSASHLALIARFPAAVQAEILKDLRNSFEVPTMTVEELERELAERLLVLRNAKWDLTDTTLVPKAGSCAACLKRSGCSPGLFEPFEAKKPDDKCLDRVCWKTKNTAWLKQREAEARANDPKIKTLTYDSTGADFKYYEVTEAKKSDKGAIPVFVKSGSDAGDTIYVKPNATADNAKHRATVGDGRAALKRQRSEAIDLAISNHISTKPLPQTMARPELMLSLLAALTTRSNKGAKILKARGKALLDLCWGEVASVIEDEGSWLFDNLDRKIIAAMIGMDIKKMSAAAEAAHPEPAAWKGLSDKALIPAPASEVKPAKGSTK